MSIFQHRVFHLAPSLPVPPSPPGMPPVPPAPGPDVEPVLPPPGERPVPSPDPEDVEALVPLRPSVPTAPGPTHPFRPGVRVTDRPLTTTAGPSA